MAIWQSTNFPGVRFRTHETRKHGVGPDKYFAIRAQVEGVRHEEGCGWASQGMTAKKASLILADLKKNHLVGEGPKTLAEKRNIESERRAAEEVTKQKAEAESLTFAEFFKAHYLPLAAADKTPRTISREESFFRVWLSPAFGNKPLKKILALDMERLKKAMTEGGQSPRSTEYALAVVRQVFNRAKHLGMFDGSQPTEKVKRPRYDNKRDRFLTKAEADRLLDALKARSDLAYEMTLISLYAGLRLGEILNLAWGCVDLENGFLRVVDTKSGRNRNVPLAPILKDLFSGKARGGPDDFVFPARGGKKPVFLTAAFPRTVIDLGLNAGITDPRQKISFHSMRHTFASWLAGAGCDMFTLQKLLGHETPQMTQRYSHLSPDSLKSAIGLLESTLNAPATAPIAVNGGSAD